jgi:hypothetical protein
MKILLSFVAAYHNCISSIKQIGQKLIFTSLKRIECIMITRISVQCWAFEVAWTEWFASNQFNAQHRSLEKNAFFSFYAALHLSLSKKSIKNHLQFVFKEGRSLLVWAWHVCSHWNRNWKIALKFGFLQQKNWLGRNSSK